MATLSPTAAAGPFFATIKRELLDTSSIRCGVEGTIHQSVTATGARRTRYAGLRKNALAHVLTATAINLIRIDAWWSGQPLAPPPGHHTSLPSALPHKQYKQLGNGVSR